MSKFTLRPYQEEAVNIGVQFLKDKKKENGILMLPTGSGKSVVISSIAERLDADLLVFQPSKEILEQNYAKMKLITDDVAIFSTSMGTGKKWHRVARITFATIGSVAKHIEDFRHFKYCLIDECHKVSSDSGQYLQFLSTIGCKCIGLTATPYRLSSDTEFDYASRTWRATNSQLTMLQNEENPFFTRILYAVQNGDMFKAGYLCRPVYFQAPPPMWNEDRIYTNSAGSEYSEKSVQWMAEQSGLVQHLISICRRLLKPKDGRPRNGILVFAQFIDDAREIAASVAYADFISAETTKKNRERILQEFRDGKIKVLVNCATLTTGLDIPSLDTIVIGRPTLSLSLYLQIVGRCVRLYDGKQPWVVDCVGNYNRFGAMENIYLGYSPLTQKDEIYGYVPISRKDTRMTWKQLTGVCLNKKNLQKTLKI